MKILQLTCHFSPNVGGVETHMDDLVSSLSKKKNEVFVLTYRPLTTKTPWTMYEVKKNIQILRLPWFPGFFYKLVGSPVFEFLYLLPGLFFVTPFVLLKKKFDIIHAHGLVAGFIGVFWGRLYRKKVVVSVHSIYHFPKQGFYSIFVRWIFLYAHAVLCLSMQSKDEVVLLGIPKEKVYVFTYWVNQDLFRKIPNAKNTLKLDKKFVVLFVGRLIAEKGVNVLLKSARKWNKNVALVIAGVGPLESVVKKEEDGEKIIYAGTVSQSNLASYYSAADVLIVPSIHEEGFGRVLLEALSCSTPVIAAKIGGIVEAVNEKVGYLIDISPENIKKAVEYCYNHKAELENKSREARLFAKKQYSEKNIEMITKAYE